MLPSQSTSTNGSNVLAARSSPSTSHQLCKTKAEPAESEPSSPSNTGSSLLSRLRPGQDAMPLRPLIGSCSRFVGLLAVAGCWIALLLSLSQELFPTTYDELLLGGLSYKGDVDIGLGGDYLGWGDEAGVTNLAPSDPYDLGELADTAMLLVEAWHAAVRSLPTSWDPTEGSNFPASDLVVDWGDLWSSVASSAVVTQDLQAWADGWALAAAGQSGGYLNLSYWLSFDAHPSGAGHLESEPQLQRLLQAAQRKATQHERWRLQAPLQNLPGPRELLKKVVARRATHEARQAKREQRAAAAAASKRTRDSRVSYNGPISAARAVGAGVVRVVAGTPRVVMQGGQVASHVYGTLFPSSIATTPSSNTSSSGSSSPPVPLGRRPLRPWTWFRKPSRQSGSSIRPSVATNSTFSTDGGLQGVYNITTTTTARAVATVESHGDAIECQEQGDEEVELRQREKEALVALRARLHERHAEAGGLAGLEALAAASGMALDDATLGRYLAVTHWQLETKSRDVASMVAQSVQWRLAEGVNGKMDRTRLEAAARAREVYVNGFDKEGRAVVLFTPTYDGACATEDAVYYLVYNLERALALGATRGQESYTVIVDIAQASAFPPLKAIKASFTVMGQHYPMRSGAILLVNGGGMIQWIWKVLEPLVDPRTREKVRIVSERDEAAVMASLFTPDQLEARFAGGTNNYMFDPDAYLDATYPDHLLLNQQEEQRHDIKPLTAATAAVEAREDVLNEASFDRPDVKKHARPSGDEEAIAPLMPSTNGQVVRARPPESLSRTSAKTPPANERSTTGRTTKDLEGGIRGKTTARSPSNNTPCPAETCLDEAALETGKQFS